MIVYPENWREVGREVSWSTIEDTLLSVIREMGCNSLSLSGGLDSSYMLYCMTQVFGNDIDTYTITGGEQHPDYTYSKMVTDYFGVRWHPYISPGDDGVVGRFYAHLEDVGVTDIIACDGIDEFMGGYYSHQANPTEEHYYALLRELVDDHFVPLDEVSLDVMVHLPYLSKELIRLYTQIPLSAKVATNSRKIVICSLATGVIPEEIITRRKYGFCDAHLSEPKS